MTEATLYARHFDPNRRAVLARIAVDGSEIQAVVAADLLTSLDTGQLKSPEDFERAFDQHEHQVLKIAERTLVSKEPILDGSELVVTPEMLL